MRRFIVRSIQKLAQKKVELLERYGRMTAHTRSLPDFIIGGAMKAGTTTLYDILGQHPQIIGATRKEVHFFDRQYDRGILFYKSHFPKRTALRDGSQHQPAIITGESSPSYLFMGHVVAERIRREVPAAKLIFLLRNPVDRAFSHYHHDLLRGRLKQSFAQIIDQELTKPENYLKRGHYAEQLEHFFRLFPKEQILIFNSDDFNESMQKVVAKTCDFLGIDKTVPIIYKKSHVGGYKDQMDPMVRKKLTDYYAPFNRDLEKLTKTEFHW
jgi:hypothetical protein